MILIMYSIYINTPSTIAAYVRLSNEKMQYSDSYVQKLKEEILDGSKGKERAKECASFLAIGGFCFIPPKGTLPFPVENAATSLYVSVVCCTYDATVGLLNFPFDPKMYGCISIDLAVYAVGEPKIVLQPYNPKALWFPAKSGDKLPIDSAAVAGFERNLDLYFGRMERDDGSVVPCAVTSSGKCLKWMVGDYEEQNGYLLRNTGFELIRAKRGDPVPQNAVMSGVIPTDGSLFVGRVSGNIPCYISTEGGKIHCFVYGVHNQKFSVENGEIMVLTREII